MEETGAKLGRDLSIRIHPDPVLLIPAALVIAEIGDNSFQGIVTLAQDMVEVMRSARGIGLAAPQIGVSSRVIVIQLPGAANPSIYLNPKITRTRGEMIWHESCLSCPKAGLIPVARGQRITFDAVELVDWVGLRPRRFRDATFLAAVLQHEIDHLDGVLILAKGV